MPKLVKENDKIKGKKWRWKRIRDCLELGECLHEFRMGSLIDLQ